MEDFSFPSVEQDHDSHLHHLPFPHFTTSPLWYLPSVAPLEKSLYSRYSRSLSGSASGKGLKKAKDAENYANDEEKMDMLWENFNEELARLRMNLILSRPTGRWFIIETPA
ncbi:hypothetical protein FCM35_KLT20761 [Carex littledalei]|uniref:Uncharacterized protein n=1 Tax=Carex littledalei TaxID=544730 RepID=A0A833R5E4_9POAL|nr:hypothetical protein FCM35_KLT20761 [Carex littledalei]